MIKATRHSIMWSYTHASKLVKANVRAACARPRPELHRQSALGWRMGRPSGRRPRLHAKDGQAAGRLFLPQAAGPSWSAASVATTPARIPTDAGGSSGSSGGAGGGGGGRRGGALSRSFRTTTTSAARASSSSAPLLLLLDWPRMIRPRRRVQPRSSIYYVATPPAATWWWRSTTSRARCTFHGRPCKKEDALLLRHVNAARRSRPAASNAPSACANKMLAPEDKAASLDPGPPATSMSCAAALRRSFRSTTTTS